MEVAITLAACIVWPIWVLVLSQIFKRDMATDAAATVVGLLVILAAIQS